MGRIQPQALAPCAESEEARGEGSFPCEQPNCDGPVVYMMADRRVRKHGTGNRDDKASIGLDE